MVSCSRLSPHRLIAGRAMVARHARSHRAERASGALYPHWRRAPMGQPSRCWAEQARPPGAVLHAEGHFGQAASAIVGPGRQAALHAVRLGCMSL
jgi:hypothetical protein